MSPSSIVAKFSPASFEHAPPSEVSQSGIEVCVETPSRLNLVLDRLSGLPKLRIEAAGEFCDEAIWERIHRRDLIGEISTLADEASLRQQYLYPYPVRLLSACPEDAREFLQVFGRASDFVNDIAAPIGASTLKACGENARMVLDGVEALRKRETGLVMALTRPPGHHAGRSFFGSFCHLNSAALAASLLSEHAEKVGILDVDFHHGNGTQDIFFNSSSVRCASVHEDQDRLNDWYPFTGQSSVKGERGSIFNIALNRGASEAEWLAAVQEGLAAAVRSDAGYLVLALGFDAFERDPFSTFSVGVGGYYKLGNLISRLGIPTLATLEGGYALSDLGELASAFVNGYQTS